MHECNAMQIPETKETRNQENDHKGFWDEA